jgi:hypothetical protein
MPKDATKNVDRYKVRGGQLNEFDYQQKQEDFAKASKDNKASKQKPAARKGASAKKLAARKAAKK